MRKFSDFKVLLYPGMIFLLILFFYKKPSHAQSEGETGTLRVKQLLYVRGLKYSSITADIISRLNESPYNGFAFQPVGAYETFLPKYQDFIDKVEIIKTKTQKGESIWPWVFFNRIVGCTTNKYCQNEYFQKIKGIDIYNETGALNDFFEIFKLSLRLAKETGSPGIIFDHEAYNNAEAYSIKYLAEAMNKSPAEIKQRLKEIGYELADSIHQIYPKAVFLVLAYQPYQPRYQDSPGYVIDGMLERAKEKKYEFKVVDGGEGTIWYTNFSLSHLREKLINRTTKFASYLEKYPNLHLGATIAPYEDIEKTCCWMKDWYEKNKDKIEVKTIQDFVPLFNLLFRTNEYVWIYGAGAAGPNGGYNEYNVDIAKKYDEAIEKALAPFPPVGLKVIWLQQ